MAIAFNTERLHEVTNDGIGFRDDDGNLTFVMSAGTVDPIGTPSPIGSKYTQTINDTLVKWEKFGPGDNDWRVETSGLSEIGAIIEAKFSESGSVSNEFLDHDGRRSDRSPFIVPQKCRLLWVTVTNSDNDGDGKFYLIHIDQGQGRGNNPPNVAYEFTLQDFRTFANNGLAAQNIEFDPGDKLACFQEDIGTNPDNVVITYYLQVIDVVPFNDKESFSGNIRAPISNDD